jgi:phage tail tape measure protein, TP901 family
LADELQILISAILDENSIANIDNTLKSTKHKLFITPVIDDNAIKQIQQQLSSLRNLNVKVNINGSGNSVLTNTKQEADALFKAYKQLGEIERSIRFNRVGSLSVKFDDEIRNIELLKTKITELQTRLDGLNVKNIGAFDKDLRAVNESLKLLNISKPLNDIEKVSNNLGKLSDATKGSFVNQLQKIKQGFATLSTTDINKIGETRARLETELQVLSRSVKQQVEVQNNIAYKKNVENFKNMVDELLAQHSKLRNSNLGNSIKGLTSEDNVFNQVSLNNVQRQFSILKSQANDAGLLNKNIGTLISEKATNIASYLGIIGSMSFAISKTRDLYTSILQIDTAMTSLQKVTDGTDNTYRVFFNDAINLAERLHGKISDVIDATAEWAKLGYSIPDATKLAELNLLYKNVGDVDVATGTKDMVSVMKAYKIEANNMITVLDKYNDVSNKFSISMAGIGEGMRRSASAMKLAGNDINDTLGLLVAGNNVIQDPAVVGTFLKTASMRIRGASGMTANMRREMEAEGLDMDGMLESASKVQAQLNKLTNSKVNIMLDANNFKKTYDILSEISEVWDSITDRNKAEIVEIIGGNEPHFALYVQKCA